MSHLKLGGRTLRDVSLKPRTERRPILPISEDEFQRLVGACGSLRTRVLMVPWDTRGRCRAICQAKVENFKGDYLILAADTANNRITAYSPLSEETQRWLTQYNDPKGRQEGWSGNQGVSPPLQEYEGY